MGLAKELETYRLSQATMRDVGSVQITADVVMALFDFCCKWIFGTVHCVVDLMRSSTVSRHWKSFCVSWP
jgi:hypothetical protein